MWVGYRNRIESRRIRIGIGGGCRTNVESNGFFTDVVISQDGFEVKEGRYQHRRQSSRANIDSNGFFARQLAPRIASSRS